MDFYHREEMVILVLAQVTIRKKRPTFSLYFQREEHLMRLYCHWSYQTYESLICKYILLSHFQIKKHKWTLNNHESKGRNKQTKNHKKNQQQKNPTGLLLFLPLLSHTLKNSSAKSFNKTAIPYEITDKSVGIWFTLLPSRNFDNFNDHDPE